MQVPYKNHMSSVTSDVAEKVKKYFSANNPAVSAKNIEQKKSEITKTTMPNEQIKENTTQAKQETAPVQAAKPAEQLRTENRLPRDANRPPRDQSRQPRDGERPYRDGNRPPRDPNRPPRDGERPYRDGNRPPRDPNRPPRDGERPQRDGNRPPRDPNRPARDGERPYRDGNRPPRDPNRQPRDGERPYRDGNRPPRDPNRPPRDGQRPQRDGNRPPRDNNYNRERREQRPAYSAADELTAGALQAEILRNQDSGELKEVVENLQKAQQSEAQWAKSTQNGAKVRNEKPAKGGKSRSEDDFEEKRSNKNKKNEQNYKERSGKNKKNKKAYEVLKDLTEDPAGYIAEKAAARGEGDEVWADDWAADIQVVKWLKENDGKRLYKENQAYILKILAFQEK